MILYGKELSTEIISEVRNTVDEKNIVITLAVILVGDNEASKVYIRNKRIACEKAGVRFLFYDFSERASQKEILDTVIALNDNKIINGILVQLPLPKHIDEQTIMGAIDPVKDVDGFHPLNVGNLTIGKPKLVPCTALGILELLKYYKIEIEGKNCVIIGRSNDVGKPLASLMLANNATVTVCHSRTQNLSDITKTADILISAVGHAKFIKSNMIKDGVTIVDVGINHLDGKLCGDVDFDDCITKAGNISPVPGGVGPMTVAMLIKNCLSSRELQDDIIV